jgi:uncharacterized membrane protein YhaH (DUF805 family)
MDQTELGELLFSAQGRLSRTPFLVAAAILLIIALLERALPSVLHWITGWLVYPALGGEQQLPQFGLVHASRPPDSTPAI